MSLCEDCKKAGDLGDAIVNLNDILATYNYEKTGKSGNTTFFESPEGHTLELKRPRFSDTYQITAFVDGDIVWTGSEEDYSGSRPARNLIRDAVDAHRKKTTRRKQAKSDWQFANSLFRSRYKAIEAAIEQWMEYDDDGIVSPRELPELKEWVNGGVTKQTPGRGDGPSLSELRNGVDEEELKDILQDLGMRVEDRRSRCANCNRHIQAKPVSKEVRATYTSDRPLPRWAKDGDIYREVHATKHIQRALKDWKIRVAEAILEMMEDRFPEVELDYGSPGSHLSAEGQLPDGTRVAATPDVWGKDADASQLKNVVMLSVGTTYKELHLPLHETPQRIAGRAIEWFEDNL